MASVVARRLVARSPRTATTYKSATRLFYNGQNNIDLKYENISPYNDMTKDSKLGAAKMLNEYLVLCLKARVYDVAIETALNDAPNLSALTGNRVYIKREDMQPVFSFKIRGAYNKIANLSPEQLKKGIVTCSAGNHAQGVAMSASKIGINATIVMPEATPKIKVNAARRFGGNNTKIVLHGKNYDEASAEAKRLVDEQGLTLVHPFDDPLVIAGQATIGMEILKAMASTGPDIVFVCTGGGGLLAGIASYFKAVSPNVKIIGVEAMDAAGMTESLRAGKVVTLPKVGPFADGAAVRTVGNETFRVCSELVDEMVTVRTDEICAAIKLGFNDTRTVMEPAGALAIAGLVKYSSQHPELRNKNLVAIASGANMDFDRLRFVSERADAAESLMRIVIPEVPGSFRTLHSLIFPRNITEFSYRMGRGADEGTYPEMANVIASFQTPEGITVAEDKNVLLELLKDKGYDPEDLSSNEMAKAHARYMSGGRMGVLEPGIKEVVYRFEFPEHAGALKTFLETLSTSNTSAWTISLFHYRNVGHDFGRVLVGLLVQDGEEKAVEEFLNKLGYTYYDESGNTAYTSFLK